MAYLLLALGQVVGLLLIPLGLPGLWLQVGAFAAFAWYTQFATVGPILVGIVVALAVLAEVAELLLGGHYAKRYGGGRRAGIGAVVGGVVGAVAGIPIPLLGSVFGAMLGSFVGAVLFELTAPGGSKSAVRAGWGALLGRLVATAMKGGVGVVVAVLALLGALR